MLKQTPLNALHRAAGAKMVDFAGWDMPLHYGSQLEEHRQVRQDAGMFDVSHMLAIDIQGKDARAYLRRVLANDVAKLVQPGAALYSCMLNEQGGILDDLTAYAITDMRIRLVVNAATAEDDLAWLTAQRSAGQDVVIEPKRHLAMIAVQGPNAVTKLRAALPELEPACELRTFSALSIDDFFVARTGYTGEDGFELMCPGQRASEVWQRLAQADVRFAGLGARDTLRLEAALNLYGQDMDATITPLECGLAWTVSFAGERDFIGRAALMRSLPQRRRAGLVLLEGGVLRAHQRVITEVGDGVVTSGGFSPIMNRSIALALVPKNVTSNTIVRVVIRERELSARVVTPPFVKHGTIVLKEKL